MKAMNTTEMHIPSNRVRDIERYVATELGTLYPEGEKRTFARMLFEGFLGWSQAELLARRKETVNQSDLLRFHWAVEELKQERPIQQIVGWTEFCGCRINVTSDTLIPRPETEEIAEWIKCQDIRPQHILDLCTGSGCIGIALKRHFPDAEVCGVDLSSEALKVARENATLNGTEIELTEGDILNGWRPSESKRYDLIVSNPPYVRESERKSMARNVLDYEPSMALFVPDDDPLRFYRAIASIAKEHLAKDGLLAVEINEALAEETCRLFNGQGFSTAVHTDFLGKHRWVSAKKEVQQRP